MEQIAVFQEKVVISPIDLHAEITSFDDILMGKLKKQLEGKCSRHGYVIPGSLELLSRSMGSAEKGRATADFIYFIKAQGKVYNPPDGLIVEGEVSLKNKMGCYVIIDDAVRVMIPRDLHIGNAVFDALSVGDRIRLQIKKSQFRANSTHILSIAQFLGMAEGVALPLAEAVEVGAEAELAGELVGELANKEEGEGKDELADKDEDELAEQEELEDELKEE
jgi:DNA-directed RNA polymerase subunit E'/Rpb7